MNPIQIGSLQLENNVFYAPLSGCSDLSYRLMVEPFRPGLLFCEMVSMEALLYGDKKTFHYLDYRHDEHPLGAQIYGSDPDHARDAAKIIEDLGFDLIDLNCGCPVDKVTKKGGGSGLLKTPERIGDIIYQMKRAVSIPVTMKIRAGDDDEHIIASKLVAIGEAAGADLVTIHGRTRKQEYRGKVHREWILEAKQAAKKIPVFGNGDIFSSKDAKVMFEETGCDGIMLARGTFGKPWLVDDIRYYFQTGKEPERTLSFCKEQFIRHVELIIEYAPYKRVLSDLYRIICWYTKHFPHAREKRKEMLFQQSPEAILQLTKQL